MWDFLTPKGADDPKIYWIRRGLVIGIPAVLIIVIAALAWPRGATTVTNPTPTLSIPEITASPSPWIVPSPSLSPTGSASPSASASATAKPSGKPKPTLPPAPVNCASSDLYVSIEDMGRLVYGKTHNLTLGFRNNSDKTCLLNVNNKVLTVTIVSGSDRVWTTTGCSKWVPTVKNEKVKAGALHTVKMSWPAKRSVGGCSISNEMLDTGTYRIEVTLEGANTFKKSLIMNRG